MRILLHGLTFFIPLLVLVFLVTGPHGPAFSAMAVLLVLVPVGLDALSAPDRSAPDGRIPARAWDALLWGLTALHLALIAVLPWYVARSGAALDSAVAVFLVGNASAQGIVLAHELVHRPGTAFRTAGRALLAGVLYEHFYTEHVRGHHKRVGTPDDPATARHGERFWAFFLRTVPGQLRSAWELECRRVGTTRALDPRQLGNRVVQGAVVGWTWLAAMALLTGPLGALAHLGQALFAVVMLEAVNWFEHWGLQRHGKRVTPADSWDSESGLTYYMLIGLARHGDHHAHAARPWQDLRVFDETPKLPWGYLATAYCAVFADRILIPRLDAELRARGMGPYSLGSSKAA